MIAGAYLHGPTMMHTRNTAKKDRKAIPITPDIGHFIPVYIDMEYDYRYNLYAIIVIYNIDDCPPPAGKL
jgi:hypothetical protein